MNFVPINELNEAKQKIMYLLQSNYSSGEEYNEIMDQDADTLFKKIINYLVKSSDDILTINTFLSNINEGVIDVEDIGEREKLIKQYAKDFESIENNILIDDGIIDEAIENIKYRMPANDFANLQKKKKLYQQQLMYEVDQILEEHPEIVEKINNAKMDFINNKINIKNSSISGYIKNIGSYSSFMQISTGIKNNLNQINNIFYKIINNIKYVEPENINEYYKAFENFKNSFKSLMNYAFYNNKFRFTKYSSGNSTSMRQEELNSINNIYEQINKQFEQIEEYDILIKSSYNYTHKNMNNKRRGFDTTINGLSSVKLNLNEE